MRRYSGSARFNHWIVAITLCAAAAERPVAVPSAPLSDERAVRRWPDRALAASLDRRWCWWSRSLACSCASSGRTCPEFTDFVWLARIRHVLAASDDYLPEIGKYNAGQKFVFWSQFVLVGVLFVTGVWSLGSGPRLVRDPARLQGHHRAEALGGADPCGRRPVAGHRHLDHPRLRCDLGARHHQRHDARHGDRRLGLAPPPQVAAQGSD